MNTNIWQVSWTSRDGTQKFRTFSEADAPDDPYEGWEGPRGEAEAFAAHLEYMFRYSEHSPRIRISRAVAEVGDPCGWNTDTGVHERGWGRDRNECIHCDEFLRLDARADRGEDGEE